ncbi:testis-specific serine/threonine-protein kinase 3 [Dermatophagoides farinae]|uniref:testis-specific serine/threonine-protein kinase 3 n=1 Tax=Dermatophagoides farinae TaxID=6954 RepID=UPI003F5DDAD8
MIANLMVKNERMKRIIFTKKGGQQQKQQQQQQQQTAMIEELQQLLDDKKVQQKKQQQQQPNQGRLLNSDEKQSIIKKENIYMNNNNVYNVDGQDNDDNTIIVPETPKWLQFNGYQYQKILGEGTYGKIFCARNIKNGEMVAIKQIDRNNPSIQQWLDNGCLDREMKITLAIRHQNLIGAIDVLKFRSIAFIVMPLIDGGNIRQLMFRQRRPFNERRTKKLFYDMAKGMNYLHRNRIVHRDLKLENLLIHRQYDRLMIGDFGFAKILPSTSSMAIVDSTNMMTTMRRKFDKNQCNSPCGTIEYTAPEVNLIRLNYLENSQFNNQQSYDGKAADIYSMGICLFEMLYFCNTFIKPEEYLQEMNILQRVQLVYRRQMTQQWTENNRVKISTKCSQLLIRLLQINAEQRPTIIEIIENDPWLYRINHREQAKREKLRQITTLINEYMAMNDDDDDVNNDNDDDGDDYGGGEENQSLIMMKNLDFKQNQTMTNNNKKKLSKTKTMKIRTLDR